MSGLRVIVYDRTCPGRWGLPGLTQAWRAGGTLYGVLGRTDAVCAAGSWSEALDWLAQHGAPAPLAEIQYWGHGQWGRARLGGESLDAGALVQGHPHHDRLRAVAARLLPDGLFWFRTCETFGTAAGLEFARAWTRFFGCRTAGHTHVIGLWQSGLHSLAPGAEPDWSASEGLPPGGSEPRVALGSGPGAPHTITCFQGTVPAGW
jgi:hypothetical protein